MAQTARTTLSCRTGSTAHIAPVSHTDDHRPYWVQSAEHGTREWHDHDLFGKPVTVSRKKRDERGNVILTERPVPIRLGVAAHLHPPVFDAPKGTQARYPAIREEARRRLAAGEPAWATIDGLETKLEPVWEQHVKGRYVDYCTIDEPVDRDGRLAGTTDQYAPCTRTLSHVQSGRAFERTRGERASGVHRDWRIPSRRRVASATRQLTLLADAGEDMDDDFLDTLAR